LVIGSSAVAAGVLVFSISKTAQSISVQTELVQSAKGEKYVHQSANTQTENGNKIFINIAPVELDSAWSARTGGSMLQKDARGQLIQTTLIRYLTSKGLTKDAAGIDTTIG